MKASADIIQIFHICYDSFDGRADGETNCD